MIELWIEIWTKDLFDETNPYKLEYEYSGISVPRKTEFITFDAHTSKGTIVTNLLVENVVWKPSSTKTKVFVYCSKVQ